MQPINGFENVQAVHGRSGMLRGGTYAMVITAAKEDTTGYGNQSIRIAYDITHGEFKGRYADIVSDPEQNWRHEVEIDVQESNGARFKALIDAVQASNPGYVWDWNEQGLVGKHVGIVLQERMQTNTRGKRKGQTSTYLDFWDAVPVQSVIDGTVNIVPPVNDKRTVRDERPQQHVQAPVIDPGAYAQQPAPQPPMQAPVIQQPVMAAQQMQMPMQQPMQQAPMPPAQYPQQQYPQQQAQQYGYQQPMQPRPTYQAQPEVADDDIPF